MFRHITPLLARLCAPAEAWGPRVRQAGLLIGGFARNLPNSAESRHDSNDERKTPFALAYRDIAKAVYIPSPSSRTTLLLFNTVSQRLCGPFCALPLASLAPWSPLPALKRAMPPHNAL